MTNVSEWSVTAGLNINSPPDGWPEGMARSAVNDTAREMMGALARWYKDSNGTLLSGGGTTAYTLTTNSGHTSLSDIPLLVFRANVANTGAATLNVDGLGAKPWQKDASLSGFASGEIVAGRVYVVAYDSSVDDFFTIGPVHDSSVPGGTSMVFYQASVPTGWTGVAQNNKALRVVSGGTTGGTAGGSTAFTSVFTSRTIAQANLPSYTLSDTLTLPDHGHSHSLSLPDHAHSDGSYALASTAITNGSSVTRNFSESTDDYDQPGGASAVSNVSWSSDTLSLSSGNVNGSSGGVTSAPAINGSVGSVTSGPSINGSVTSGGSGTAMDFAVQYIDVCVGTKD